MTLVDPLSKPDVIRAIVRKDLQAFVEASFPIVSPASHFVPGWHIEAITYQLMRVERREIRRLIITVPPRSLKSICASVAFPAWLLGRNPRTSVVCVSYSEALARKHANDCRALMRSSMYGRVFPATRISPGKDTELEFATTLRGGRLATSTGGTLTGRGGDIIILDDPLKADDGPSRAARDGLREWYSNTLLSRLNNPVEGAIILVMQRLHSDDLAGHLIEQGGWVHLNLPARAEVEQAITLRPGRTYHRRVGEVLQPARLSHQELEAVRQDMGSMNFAAQYQQEPVPPGGNLIQWSWFQTYAEAPRPERGDRIIISWDTAMSMGELADYSAGIVMLVRNETVFILDVTRARLTFPELRRKVLDVHRRWRHIVPNYALLIENKGSGLSLVQELRAMGIHAIGVEPKGDKEMRAVGQTSRIEDGAVQLPIRAPWLDEFRHEISAFPNGRYDDQVDALSQGLNRAFSGKGAWAVTVVRIA